jgi:hypothetical protein
MSLDGGDMLKEMESWRGFGDALRAEDRELFHEMLRECYELLPAMEVKSSPFPNEALFMGLIFLQHKTILWLQKEVEGLRREPG